MAYRIEAKKLSYGNFGNRERNYWLIINLPQGLKNFPRPAIPFCPFRIRKAR